MPLPEQSFSIAKVLYGLSFNVVTANMEIYWGFKHIDYYHIFVIYLFFCGIRTCPSFFGRICCFLRHVYFELSCFKEEANPQPRVFSTASPVTGERYRLLCNSRYRYWRTVFTLKSRTAFIKSNDEARKDGLDGLPFCRSYIFQPVVSPFQFLLRHSFGEGFAEFAALI